MFRSGLLLLLAALGLFLSAAFDLAMGNLGSGAVSIVIGILLLAFMPAGPKPKRRI